MAPGQTGQAPASPLSITVWDDPHGQPHRWLLTCYPAGGDHPDPEPACAALSRSADPFAPVPHGTICAQIVLGPQRATIDGTWRGQSVHAEYSRTDSCQNQRWQALAEVFRTGQR